MKNYKRKILISTTLMCITILAFTLNSKAQQVNFSGSWKLNLEKSDFGNVSSRAAVQSYQVEQGKEEMFLKWTTKNEANEEVASAPQKLLLDSTPATTLLPSQRTRVISAKFSENGKSLLISKSISKPNSPKEVDYVLKENWQLINSGKELLIELTSPSYVIKAVYEHPGLSVEMKE